MFLILFGIVYFMKYIAFLFLLTFIVPAQAEENPWTWNHGIKSLKDWGSSHWKSQNFEPSVQKQHDMLRSNTRQSQSMFANIDGLDPTEFIQNLKNAKIIKGAFNQRTGFFKQHISQDVVIELDENFYTLSSSDQALITELLAKSYNQENYLLKDTNTKNIVGQITPEGFYLF